MFILSDTPSISNQFICELRDIDIQKDRMRFRFNLERLGAIMAYEISKSLPYENIEIQTPLSKTQAFIPKKNIVIFSILRASLPFYQGFLNFFDGAESGFIGAYRANISNEKDIEINLDYHSTPSITGKTIIIVDPMLATGKSFVRAIDKILTYGTPACIHIASLFAAPEGIEYLKKHLNCSYHIWLGTLDDHLNELSYIVPGCGDAGNLAFGDKL